MGKLKILFILCIILLLFSACSFQARYDGKSIWNNNEAVLNEHMTMLSDSAERAVNSDKTVFLSLYGTGLPVPPEPTQIAETDKVKELIKDIVLSEEAQKFTLEDLEYPVVMLIAKNEEQAIFTWAFYGEKPMLYYNPDSKTTENLFGYEIKNYEEIKSRLDEFVCYE